MKNIVNLKDINFNQILEVYKNDSFYMKEIKNKINIDNLKKSYNYYLKHDLKYNQKQGKLYSKNIGVLSEYCFKKDIPEYENILEIIEVEFLTTIISGASRLQRGYDL